MTAVVSWDDQLLFYFFFCDIHFTPTVFCYPRETQPSLGNQHQLLSSIFRHQLKTFFLYFLHVSLFACLRANATTVAHLCEVRNYQLMLC